MRLRFFLGLETNIALLCVYLKLFQGSCSLLNFCSNSFIKTTVTLLHKQKQKNTKTKKTRKATDNEAKVKINISPEVWIPNHRLIYQPGRNGKGTGFLSWLVGNVRWGKKGRLFTVEKTNRLINNWTETQKKIKGNSLLGRTSSSTIRAIELWQKES